MELDLYQVDAFASRPFEGNPAAVCPLDAWLPDDTLQAIAVENNLSETAYFVPTEKGYHIRWFTPASEVKLCGHATLASAYVLFHLLKHVGERIEFDSLSGPLIVERVGDWLRMDFPAQPPVPCQAPAALRAAFDAEPLACLKSEDYILVFADEAQVRAAQPDLGELKKLDLRAVAITAPGREHDFVARLFAPRYGIDEDPVTGSLFTELAPYWAGVLAKKRMHARQVSRRGGEVRCELAGERVLISGQAAHYLSGKIRLPG
jgi:predicted PhzF superfamily epimerase YddE/YHI9